MRLGLHVITRDAGTQVRAVIDAHTVRDYAEHMAQGVEFPPVVVFRHGTTYVLADGFHRVAAALDAGARDIEVDLRDGTTDDALWFALGANRTNGLRLTWRDKHHAIYLALQRWPDRSSRHIAAQIGVHQQRIGEVRKQLTGSGQLPDRIIGNDGKNRPAVMPPRPTLVPPIAPPAVDRSRGAVALRRSRVRELAADGATTRQIMQELHVGRETVKTIAAAEGIAINADRAIGRARHPNANRIVDSIVVAAENVTAAADLVDYRAIDHARLPEWIAGLVQARRSLLAFIRRLEQERTRHAESSHARADAR